MPRARAARACRGAARRSFETEPPRARPARRRCLFATAEEEAGATQQRRPASGQRGGRASSAPSPTVVRAEARGGARVPAGPRSLALTELSRQAPFLNIHLQAARASNSQDSNRTKQPKGEKSCSARHPRFGRAV